MNRLPILLVGTAAVLLATAAGAADVTVTVSGLASREGRLLCALHPDGTHFPGAGPGVATDAVPADPAGTTCRFQGVEPGTYAVAVFHDANGNGELDTNFVGIPSEDWAVSNNVRPMMGAPSFDDAAVPVPAEGARLSIRLGG